MKLWRTLISWWSDSQRKTDRRGRRELARLFRERHDLLRKTSLKPKHFSRVQVISVHEPPLMVTFGIVRHPRPYQFSRQFHEVLEVWEYEVGSGRLQRMKGKNLTRAKGQDGDPSSSGLGI